MASILDAVIGKLVEELMSSVVEMKDRALKFKPTLERLETTLKSLAPLIKEIDEYNKKLDRSPKETDRLINQMKEGKKLVLKCSDKEQMKWWNCCYKKAEYQEKLEALDDEIKRFFELDLRAQDVRNGLETLVEIKEFRAEFRSGGLRNERIELRGVCLPPQPPGFTVGLDGPLNELKMRLLKDEVSVSVVTVTGSGGSGKSTLAKRFCWDEQVKGKFKENIFFITFAKTPKLNAIVRKIYQHTGYEVPEFQSDEDTFNQLEYLMKQIVKKSPILLVLDDVWLESVSLVDNFVFEIPNYKIMVTSRFAIARFGHPFVLKPLSEAHAINLFKHSASLTKTSSDVPDDVVKKIVRCCSGSPLALRVSGRSLSNEHQIVWLNRAKELSAGSSILDSSKDVLSCLQKSLDVLDSKSMECFRDLGLFPEDQRIPAAALIDMWAELRDDDEATAMERIYKLVNLNLADIIVTRKVASGAIDYNYHYVTQYGLLRDLAIRDTDQEADDKRNRLIIDTSANHLPSWWTSENEYRIAARILSISTDETFTTKWCNLQPTKVEALVINLREKKCTLPMFMKEMKILKVLIITNYDFYPAELDNFELLDHLTSLKRIRFEKISVPFLGKTIVHLNNLKNFSFFMCNVNKAFENCTIQDSEILPSLMEMNFDYCSDMVQLPNVISNIVSLKKLSITNCHNLCALHEGIGNLVNLESLRLSSCSDLSELPNSITNLHKLKFLDISGCISLSQLPENMCELEKLEKLNMRGCSSISELPSSIMELKGLKHVICDEEAAEKWEPFRSILGDLRIEVVQEDFNLNFLYN
ncbi:probable disease resistance protein At5g66900 [Trifolium pratense]|uniref:probable disease resistance protein At5g66900 n=1 Tax=Trifolium pratense TaxID=57577 RepID=UPI001E6933EB|nr:probable disease resistance protein At5g66900 [Trifolium pratense]